MSKVDLREIAKETVEIVRQGHYNLGNQIVQLNNVEKGRLYTSVDLDSIDISRNKEFNNTTLEVINEGTVDAVFRLDMGNIGVLNFASAYHPGGGFLQGAKAQEECLAFCSNLYETLKDNEFYEIHSKIKSKMYSDSMIVGNVEFFRDSNLNFVSKPKTVKVVTSAAVNMGQVILKGEDTEVAKQVMKNRMRKVLKLFIKEDCETVVLGAFGCGVFANNPEDVATNWVDLLLHEGYYKYFKHIVFSIYDKPNVEGNFAVFKRIIGSRFK